MSATLKQGVLNYKPRQWQSGNSGNYEGCFQVCQNSEEFDDVATSVRRAGGYIQHEIETIQRVQNVILWGQFICREQHLAIQHRSFRVVRKFLIISKMSLRNALQYNLDSRRLGCQELTFTSRLNFHIGNDKALLVILVLTESPNNDFQLRCSSDYYIEYIVSF